MTASRSDGKWSEVLRQLERALDHEVRATEVRILRLRHRAFHLLTSGLGLLGVGRLMAWGFQL